MSVADYLSRFKPSPRMPLGESLYDQFGDYVDYAKKGNDIELAYLEQLNNARKADLAVYKIIMMLSGVADVVPDSLSSLISDEYGYDVADLQGLSEGILSKTILTNMLWQGLFAAEGDAIDVFVQQFVDYMIKFLNKEELEIDKIKTHMDAVAINVGLIEAELQVYDFGSIRASLNAANSELGEALATISSALSILSTSKTPDIAISDNVLARYAAAQKILKDNINKTYDEASSYNVGNHMEIIWDLSKEISGHLQSVGTALGNAIKYDYEVKSARMVIVGLDDLIGTTVGAAERYFIEAYLEKQYDSLEDVIDGIKSDLIEFKFEPRLIGTAINAYAELNYLKVMWGGGSMANVFLDHYKARAGAVEFADKLRSHPYFADFDYLGGKVSIATTWNKIWTMTVESGKKILYAVDGQNGIIKAVAGLVNNVSFEVDGALGSLRSLRGTLTSYGRFEEDPPGIVAGLNTFILNATGYSMVGFILGMAKAVQLGSLAVLGFNSATGYSLGAGLSSAMANAQMQLKAVADHVVKGKISTEMAKVAERTLIDTAARENEADELNVGDSYAKYAKWLEDRMVNEEKDLAESQGLNEQG